MAKQNIYLRNVKILQGHKGEVMSCAWHPVSNILATGSSDMTARIWDISRDCKTSKHRVLWHHLTQNVICSVKKDVHILQWNFYGTYLISGSFDGTGRIWTNEGYLAKTLQRHNGPILALKCNKRGNYIVSGGVDKAAFLSEAATGECIQQFNFHSGPILDVDWCNNTMFASCGIDNNIFLCEVNIKDPIKIFRGHTDSINMIAWDPQGRLLASCSDDKTVKIWSFRYDNCISDLPLHSKEINNIKWSPTGPGTANSNMNLMLASVSLDKTVVIWDVEIGVYVHRINRHLDSINSIAFSPDGKFLVTCSFDNFLYIWSTQSGELIRKFSGNNGFCKVGWNAVGDKLCVTAYDGNVLVFDIRHMPD